jgi:chromosome segregation ATPase
MLRSTSSEGSLAQTDAKVDQLGGSLAQTDAKVDQLGSSLAQTDAKVDQLGGSLAQTDAKVEQLGTSFAKIDAKVDELRSDMKSEFATLRNELDDSFHGVEWKIEALNENMLKLQANQKYAQRRLQDLESHTKPT